MTDPLRAGHRVPVKVAVIELQRAGAPRSRATIFGHIAAGRLRRYRKPGLSRDTYVDLDELADLVEIPRTNAHRSWWAEPAAEPAEEKS